MPKPPKPIAVEEYNKVVARQHKEADTDRDGFLTVAEVRDGVARLAQEAIRTRFEGIDTDGNGTITYAEFSSWQTTLGSRALSDRAASGVRVEMIPTSLPFDVGSGDSARLFRRMIQPLNPVMVSQSDQNYDGQVSVEELQTFQRKPFNMVDANSDGFIDFMEMQKAGPGMGQRRAGMPADGMPPGMMPPGMMPPGMPPSPAPTAEADPPAEAPPSAEPADDQSETTGR
ncbi:MAG: EF-hand domain-containing protein [Erythrobacter sp.]|uniref:EF-hand domain-containing protein n=1 Tax=Erythrobacter sp. TaxID=1042 RepID=UPI0026386A25|nr:EF-hand domain-containing protein [Erythrobacter sp.]MDJ0977095.1 EF-hand domain-containing protein [Erythrobacter sp.]